MRYELYTHNESADIFTLCIESDSIISICTYIEDYPKVDTNFQWIIIDNEPTEFNLCNLGFAEMPTREELKNRIVECKYYRCFKANTFEEMVKEYDSKRDEYRIKTEAEADELINKLFQYEPIITKHTLQYRSIKPKYHLVRELSALTQKKI